MKLYLLCFLAIISCIKIQGQNYDNNKNEFESEYRDETIRNSEYVFEGSIIKLSLYRRDNKCVTSYIVKIKDILRGDSLLKLGTVEILNYSEICFDYRDTADFTKYKLDTVGFFFCRKANEFTYDPQFNIDKVDNNVILTGYHNNKIYELDWIGKTSSGGAYYSGLFKKYDTKYDVYKELKNFPNLKLPHKIEPQKLTAREASFGEIRSFTKEQVDSIIEAQNRREYIKPKK